MRVFRRGYAGVFAMAAVVSPFVSYVLGGHGWPPGTIGTALALFTIAGTLAAPFWGWLDDRLPGRAVRITVPGAALASLALGVITVVAPGNRAAVTAVLCLFGFCSGALESLVTGAVARARRLQSLGSLRTAGSWGWIAGLLCVTSALAAGAGGAVFALAAVAAVFGLPMAGPPRVPPGRAASGSQPGPSRRRAVGPLARVLLLGLPIPIANFTLMYFTTGWVRTNWGAEPLLAVLPLLLAALLEVPALLLADRVVRRLSPLGCLRMALLLLAATAGAVAAHPTLLVLLLVQPAVALMTAFWLVGQAHAVVGVGVGRTIGRDLALAAATAKGSSAIVAGIGGGLLSERFGLPVVLLLEAGLAAVVLIVALLSRATTGSDKQTNRL